MNINFIKQCLLLILISPSTLLFAHQVENDEHINLVPIPAYTEVSQVHGKASGVAAVKSAKALIDSFNQAMQSKLVLESDDESRKTWSNLPARMVTRGGLKIADMTDPQRKKLFEFLAASLGEEGYIAVAETLAAEAFLANDPLAERFLWAPENYWLAFYGKPKEDALWGWQFGGHHLALNISVDQGTVNSMSPSFVGVEPAFFSYSSKNFAAIADMHQTGFDIYQSLDKTQKAIATLGGAPSDVITGPGKDRLIPPLVGISGKQMTDEQKTLMLAAIREWVEIQPSENAQLRMQQIETDIDKTFFSWFGSMKQSSSSYFRIQGPSVIIELLSIPHNVGKTAKDLGHYHTIYRNPTFEYGMKPRRRP